MSTPKPRVALCMRGAVSKLFGPFVKQGTLYNSGEYVNFRACFESIRRHILEPNKEKYDIDIFVHCWTTELESEIIELYGPKSHLFESNTIYNEEITSRCNNELDFPGISQALTMKKVLELKEEYEKSNGFEYDRVILYRYDVLLWKNIVLDVDYKNLNSIYVNEYSEGDDGCNGDFHFIMSNENARQFKYLYESF